MGSAPNPPRNPFIAGSWVRGDDFFGRADSIREVLEGERHSLWVLGGAPPRQDEPPEGARAPGAAQPRDAVRGPLLGPPGQRRRPRARRDAPLERRGLRGRSAAPPTSRSRTWRACPSRRCSPPSCGARCAAAGGCCCSWTRPRSCWWWDAADPGVLARLRRVLSRGPDVRTVITATRLLARIDEDVPMPTSPFLQGFIPPVYLTPLSPDEGRALLARGGFAAGGRRARPRADRVPPVPRSSCSRAGSSRAATWRRRSTSSPRTR